MKKILVSIILSAFLVSALGVPVALAAQKGASAAAREHASDEAIFHRIGDWFATVGKSEEEKTVILTERKAKRAVAKAQKEAEKEKRKLEKKMKKAF